MVEGFLQRLEPGLQGRLQRLAEAQGRTAEALLHEAVGRYVGQAEAREALRAGAQEAWAEYKSTGRCAQGGAVDAWLARLEAGHDAEPPPCPS